MRRSLSIALMFLLLGPLVAARESADSPSEELAGIEELRVYATPLANTSQELAQPVTVLAGDRLERAVTQSLGDTLAGEPGITTTYFGPAVGRPVIRGLGGPRVRVLEDGIVAADVSVTSADHAVGVEPFLADQVEVMKGASTVLYGSGAIGGVVNTVTGKIPTELPDEPFSLRAQGSVGDVADEENGGIRANARAGNFAFHLGGNFRRTNDYDISGFAESAAQRDAEALEEEEEHGDEDEDHDEDEHGDEEEEEEVFGSLENSDLRTDSFNFGTSWVGERVTLGVAYSRYESEYGIPGGHGHEHGHHEDHDEEDGDHDDEDGDHDEEEEEEGDVRLDLKQERYDFYASLMQPIDGIEMIRFRGAYVDYEHDEIEGSGEVGVTFDNQNFEGRIELLNAPIAGFEGAFGLQFENTEFSAVGEEAFVPPVDRSMVALFAFQQKQVGDLLFDVGARVESVDYDPDAGGGEDFTIGSLSFGTIWEARDNADAGIQLDIASRAPGAEELYSNGAHLATNTFEIGDPTLDEETAFNASAFWHGHFDAVDIQVNVFATQFKDFIYLSATGAEEDELPVFVWRQEDALFFGGEVNAVVPLMREQASVDLRITGDTVRARLRDPGPGQEEDLPRIPASRLGAALEFQVSKLSGEISLMRVFRQDETAAFENASNAYTALDAYFGWDFEMASTDVEFYLRGRNLLDVEQRLHTSFLADLAPLPGRALEAGIRIEL